jgi:hypothetical protein
MRGAVMNEINGANYEDGFNNRGKFRVGNMIALSQTTEQTHGRQKRKKAACNSPLRYAEPPGERRPLPLGWPIAGAVYWPGAWAGTNITPPFGPMILRVPKQARLQFVRRPSMTGAVPSASSAFCAESACTYVTNPYPFDLPVLRSVMTTA